MGGGISTVTVTEALVLGRPRAHHRVHPYLGARRQNETEMFSDHNKTSRYHLRSTDADLLYVPRTRTSYCDRSFAVCGPTVWNSLPASLRIIKAV